MLLDKIGDTIKIGNMEYCVGMRICATEASEYSGLYGYISEIRDGEDKDTENETVDIICGFFPPADEPKIKAYEEIFSDLYGEKKTIDEIVLDNVVMSPEMICPI